ncbi:MAG: DUF721 domain-containing protein [Rickettsiales bacterium]|jgi:hypothetical protein|nr:DUF721 domain-containing protein [Rickettsiales bacterium]
MKTEKRDTRPMFLGPAINRFLIKIGATMSDGDLADNWNEISAGLPKSKLAKLSCGKKNRTVRIVVENPAERLTLSYAAPELIRRINAYFGYDAVTKVAIR